MNGQFWVRAGRFLLYVSLLVIPVANAPLTSDTLEIKAHLFRLLGMSAAILYVALVVSRARAPAVAPDARPSRHAKLAAPAPPLTPAPDAADLALVINAVVLAASAFFAESRLAAMPGAIDGAASLAFLALAREVFTNPSERSGDPFAVAVAASAVLPALFYLCDYFHLGIPDSLGNQNIVSHYLLLSLAAPIYFVLRGGRYRWAGAALGIFLIWVNWLTAARGAVVGALVALAVLTVLTAARLWLRMSSRQRTAVVIVCVVMVLAAPALLYTYATSTDFNVSVRFLSWKYSISLLADRLWLGYGPGLFSTSFEKTKLWMTDKDSTLLGLLTVNYAHNDYVEIAVDQGALGLAAFLFLALACLTPAARTWVMARNWQIASMTPSEARAAALLFGLVASLAQAAFDFPYHTPAPRLLFFVLLGAVASRPSRDGVDEDATPGTAGEWSLSAVAALTAILPAVPLLAMYSASTLSHAAEAQFKRGQYQEVKHMHAWAATQDPTRSQYWFRKGLGDEQAREFDAARASFRNALNLQAYFPNIYFHLGVTALEQNPSRAAAGFYSNLAFAPASVALHNLAAMSLALGDSGAAASVYREIARRYPDDERARHNVEALLHQRRQERPALFRRAFDFYQQNRLDLAEPLAGQFVRDEPSDDEGLFLLGKIIFHRGKHAESERLFRQYVKRQGDDPDGHYYLGNALYFQNRYTDSLDAYRVAARLNPGSPKILYNLGVNYYFVGDAQSMNDCFDTVLAINPDVSFKDKIEELRQSTRRKTQP